VNAAIEKRKTRKNFVPLSESENAGEQLLPKHFAPWKSNPEQVFGKQVSCYIEGDGSQELRKALTEHVADCRRCRVILDTTGQMLVIVRDAEPFLVPLALSARLYSRLERVFSDT
jgi:hypothetical protein